MRTLQEIIYENVREGELYEKLDRNWVRPFVPLMRSQSDLPVAQLLGSHAIFWLSWRRHVEHRNGHLLTVRVIDPRTSGEALM